MCGCVTDENEAGGGGGGGDGGVQIKAEREKAWRMKKRGVGDDGGDKTRLMLRKGRRWSGEKNETGEARRSDWDNNQGKEPLKRTNQSGDSGD